MQLEICIQRVREFLREFRTKYDAECKKSLEKWYEMLCKIHGAIEDSYITITTCHYYPATMRTMLQLYPCIHHPLDKQLLNKFVIRREKSGKLRAPRALEQYRAYG